MENQAERQRIILKAIKKQQLDVQLHRGLPSFIHVLARAMTSHLCPKDHQLLPQLMKVSFFVTTLSSSTPLHSFKLFKCKNRRSFLTDDVQGKVSVVQIFGDVAQLFTVFEKEQLVY